MQGVVSKAAATAFGGYCDAIPSAGKRDTDSSIGPSPWKGDAIHVKAEMLLQQFPGLAAVTQDFFVRKYPEVSVRGRMASDFEPPPCQFSQIVPVHQRKRRPRCRIPVSDAANLPGHDEDRGAEIRSLKKWKRVSDKVMIAVIEGDYNGAPCQRLA